MIGDVENNVEYLLFNAFSASPDHSAQRIPTILPEVR
jgi:hypothetical protein